MQFLDLGVDAAILYQAMIHYPRTGMSELNLWLAWPEDRIERALGELERLNLIAGSWQGQEKPVLMRPDVALAELLAGQEAALVRHQADMIRNRVLVASLVAEHERARFEHGELPDQRVLGPAEVQRFADRLAESCATEMMSFAPGGPPTGPLIEVDQAEDLRLLNRRVRIRRIHLESIVNNTAAFGCARWLIEQGGEVRTTPSLPVRMSVYDRSVAIVAMDPEQSADAIVVLRGTGVLAALCAFFDLAWEQARELGAPIDRDTDGLTAQNREVLRLLADGHTDAVVARKLGVSVRTTRRMIAELAERLGARSRFQIGVRAAEAGWL